MARWLLGLVVLVLAGCGPTTVVVGIGPGDRSLTETVVVDESARRVKVAMIDVTGVIVNARRDGLLQQGSNPVAELHEQLARAATDDRVKGVVLRINSPGGSVTASRMMHDEVRLFRERTGKPVVVVMMDVAASGGYYVACAADRIVAYPSTITGSIGVIMQTVSLKPALDRWGITATTIRSGEIKGAGSPLDTLTAEQREVFEGMIEAFHEQFVAAVDAGRAGLDRETINRLADGRVYTGGQAAELGLVDETGDLYLAFERAKGLAGVESADLVLYHRPLDYVAAPYAGASEASGGGGTTVNLLSVDLGESMGGVGAPVMFGYLWSVDGFE
ncbi:signal peptide peptidase SppA [Mucisphaera sp.]|uniref:signal peptide peptidase SppA n=1 Tax=Mucisphaera sp. TaxID=2913024 RepID=UPI003D107309